MPFPRFLCRSTFAGVATIAATGAIAACGDSTAPGARQSPLALDIALPPGDTVRQLGVVVTAAFRDSTPIRETRTYVDSAAGATPTDRSLEPFGDAGPLAPWRRGLVVHVPGPGRHTITVVAVDTGGRAVSGSFTRTFHLPETPYTATMLPDLGHGGEALHVNAAGDVVGYVRAGDGTPRPARWRSGALTVLPTLGNVAATAVRSNTAGDVLLAVYRSEAAGMSGAQVLRPDGGLLALPAVWYRYRPYAEAPIVSAPCFGIAAELNEQRVVLITASDGVVRCTARYDAATGAVRDTLLGPHRWQNAGGQTVGSFTSSTGFTSSGAWGFSLPAVPTGPRLYCNYRPGGGPDGSWGSVSAVGLDDDANVLANLDYCGTFAFLSATGSALLDRDVGPAISGRLSPQGGLVAVVNAAGAVSLWRAATRRGERLRLTGSAAVRVSAIGAVNAQGVIAASGVDAANRTVPLLLAPATR